MDGCQASFDLVLQRHCRFKVSQSEKCRGSIPMHAWHGHHLSATTSEAFFSKQDRKNAGTRSSNQ